MASPKNWVLWYDEHLGEDMQMEDFFEKCVRFQDVGTSDEFRTAWRMLTDGKPSIPENSNLRVFQRDVRPIVSDVANSRGGKFSMVFKGDDYVNVWHTLMSSVISDGLLPQNFMTGIVLSVRPTHSTIMIWVNSAQAYDDIDYMKSQLRLLLDVRKIMFIKHGAAQNHNPFLAIDPMRNRRPIDKDGDKKSSDRKKPKDHTPVSRGPKSCRNRLTALEDPFLRAPTPAPEMVLASSGDSGSSSSDDSCDKSLKELGIAPFKKHGRGRKKLTQKPKLLGNAEYEKALSMMSCGNTASPDAPRGVVMLLVTVWTRFWLFVNMLIEGLTSSDESKSLSDLQRWDQRFSVTCYAICISVCTAIRGLFSSTPQAFNLPRVNSHAPRVYSTDKLRPPGLAVPQQYADEFAGKAHQPAGRKWTPLQR